MVPLAIVAFGISTGALTDDPQNNLVELHVQINPGESIHERREALTYRFGILYEAFLPQNYQNLQGGATYNTLYGTQNPVPLISASLGLQWNTRIGSFYLDFVDGVGSISGAGSSSLRLGKFGGVLGFSMDHLFSDPWVVPMIGVQAVYFNWNQVDTTTNIGGMTAETVGLIGGLSIPLTRFDPDTAQAGMRDFGIRNTYLDLYTTQYMTSNSTTDPELQTNFNLAAGLHFEF